MCFSAIVSFSTAAGLTLLGLATISQITTKREVLLASFPCLFAFQQTLEGLVWIGNSNSDISSIDRIGTYGFLLFASLLWLVWSPLSIYLLEVDLSRKKFLLGLIIGGLLLGVYLFGWIIYHGVNPQTFSGNLFYDLSFIPFYEIIKYLYLVVIVLPFSIAKSSALKIFGVLVIISFIVSQIFFQVTLVSVWCFFAALLSGFLYFFITDVAIDRDGVVGVASPLENRSKGKN
jgi:hypothetical protein